MQLGLDYDVEMETKHEEFPSYRELVQPHNRQCLLLNHAL